MHLFIKSFIQDFARATRTHKKSGVTLEYICWMKKSLKMPKGVIRNRKSKKDRQYNGQKKRDKQLSTKHYTENQRSSNTNPTKNRGSTHVLRKVEQFLLQMWHSSMKFCLPHIKRIGPSTTTRIKT
jgi:hypothetical protein